MEIKVQDAGNFYDIIDGLRSTWCHQDVWLYQKTIELYDKTRLGATNIEWIPYMCPENTYINYWKVGYTAVKGITYIHIECFDIETNTFPGSDYNLVRNINTGDDWAELGEV